MSDGDIFKHGDKLLLQLGELEGSPYAPLAGIYENTSDQLRNCDPKVQKFYIPKWNFQGLIDFHFYVNLARIAIALVPVADIEQMERITTLSYPYMNVITICAISRGAVGDNIRPYLRTNRPS